MSKEAKNEFRKKFLTLIRNQKEAVRAEKSDSILKKLFSIPEFREAKTILFYASFDGEVMTFKMIKQAIALGKKVALPVILRDQRKLIPTLIKDIETLEDGPYGVLQPQPDPLNKVSVEDIDLVVVPGLAFDKGNHRLGRGAGYYDRFLKDLPKDTPAIGLAFDFQLVDCLPHQEAHDIKLSRVICN